ncbi:MAG: PIN domain-containing protein [Armatimonadaceae bacterium]
MRRVATLADAGPLIALFDEDDPNHHRCIDALAKLMPPMITTWSVVTEAMYRLYQVEKIRAQRLLWSLINDGLLQVLDIDADRRQWTQHYMEQYADRPCDLADASLLALAETLQIRQVFTIDSDFFIYVLSDGSVLEAVPGPRRLPS